LKKNKIILNDNLVFLDSLEDSCIDGVITDPYFEIMGIGNSKATKQDKQSNFLDICEQLFRVMKDNTNLVFFCSSAWMVRNFYDIESIGFNFQYDLIWNKNRGVSFLTARKRPLQKHETIYVFSKGKHFYNYEEAKTLGHKPVKRGVYKVDKDYVKIKTNVHKNDGERFMTSVLDYKVSTYRKQTSHPFEKPVDLSEHLVKAYSNMGDLILDPYSGSGNICVALKNCGRNFIGIEVDKKYHTESIENLNNSNVVVEDKIDKFLR